MPGRRDETVFALEELTDRRVSFANPAHDFPQRIVYWIERPGELSARVEGLINGQFVSETWTWERAALSP